MNKTATEVVLELVAQGMSKEAASPKQLLKFISNKKFDPWFGVTPTLRRHDFFGDSLSDLTKAHQNLKLYRRSIKDTRIPNIMETINKLKASRNKLFHEVIKHPSLDEAISRYK